MKVKNERTTGSIATALMGLSLWLVLLVIPWPPDYPRWSFQALVLYAIPPAALLLGLLLKSCVWTVGAFPIFLVTAAVSRDFLGGTAPVSVGGTALSGLSLAGYLLVSSAAWEWEKRPAEDPPELKPLPTQVVSSVWRRRRRIYAYLVAATVLYPLVLMYAMNMRPEMSALIDESYGRRAPTMKILMNIALIGVCIVVFFVSFKRPLSCHAGGDRSLMRELREYKDERNRVAWSMALLCAVALILMTLFWIGYS